MEKQFDLHNSYGHFQKTWTENILLIVQGSCQFTWNILCRVSGVCRFFTSKKQQNESDKN